MSVLDSIMNVFYGFFDSIFGSFFPVRENASYVEAMVKGEPVQVYTEYILGVILVALLISIFITLVNYWMVDYDEVKEIREEVSDYRSRLMKAKKKGNKKEIRKLEGQKKRINELNAKMTGMTMKPLLITMAPIFILFAWFRHTAAYGVPILELPFPLFDLPVIGWFFGYFHGEMAANLLGAYGLYFLCAMVFGQTWRKLLNMV